MYATVYQYVTELLPTIFDHYTNFSKAAEFGSFFLSGKMESYKDI